MALQHIIESPAFCFVATAHTDASGINISVGIQILDVDKVILHVAPVAEAERKFSNNGKYVPVVHLIISFLSKI
jgi:hypothetical protein